MYNSVCMKNDSGEELKKSVDGLVGPEGARDLIGAATLVFLGLVLLFNFLGLVPASVWEWLWKFWPTLLIFYGIKLMLGEGKMGEGLTLVLVVLVYGILGMILIDKYQLTWSEVIQAFRK